jgi:hypothetical protein
VSNQERDKSMARYHDRHPSTRDLILWLFPNPRLEGLALDIAQIVWVSAQSLVDLLEDGPELSAGLRKLLEAKDCLVRQGLKDCGVI